MSPCVCKIGFKFCALGDVARCYRWSLWPNTVDGRRAAKKHGGSVLVKDDFEQRLMALRALVAEKEKAA